jgi:hypothetical protein
MCRLFARAPRGQRAFSRAPAGRYERLTLLGTISLEELGALMTTLSLTDRAVFRTFNASGWFAHCGYRLAPD